MISAIESFDPSIFLLFSSVCDADTAPASVKHFDAKARIEERLNKSSLFSWTILRPTCFLDNFENSNLLAPGHVKFLTRSSTVVKYVAVADIGIVAAKVFETPESFKGQTLDIATVASDGDGLATALSNVSQMKTDHKMIFNPQWLIRFFMSMEMHAMVVFFETTGFSADVDKGRRLVGEGWTTLEEYFRAQGACEWKKKREQEEDIEKGRKNLLGLPRGVCIIF